MSVPLLIAHAGAGSVPNILLNRTNATTSLSETQTADGTKIYKSGQQIILDGYNQALDTEVDDATLGTTHDKANNGQLEINAEITVDIEVWGAAGGSSARNGVYENKGGGGEYRSARMILKPGTYYYIVGGGGASGKASTQVGAGGYGGGGSGSHNSSSGNGVAFGNGGQKNTNLNGVTNLFGAGGGGLTGLFGGTPNQSNSLLVAGGGGGSSGYENGGTTRFGRPGGEGNVVSRSATATAAGEGADNSTNGEDGGAGFGGRSIQSGGTGSSAGGGGGGGYWGGGGGDRFYTQSDAPGGGGMGFTVASSGHSLVGTVSNTVQEAGILTTSVSNSGKPGGQSSSNIGTYTGQCTGFDSIIGCGGRLVITIV